MEVLNKSERQKAFVAFLIAFILTFLVMLSAISFNFYMVKYKENFDHNSDTPLTETFMISARKISMGGGDFDNAWV